MALKRYFLTAFSWIGFIGLLWLIPFFAEAGRLHVDYEQFVLQRLMIAKVRQYNGDGSAGMFLKELRKEARRNGIKIPAWEYVGGRWCFCCFIQISRPLFIERRTFVRPIPRYLATSAALCPVSSTAKYATNALASAIFFCLLPEQINFGLRPNCPATNSINSSMGRLGRYFFSSILSDC